MKQNPDPGFDPLYHETTRKLKWLIFARWIGVVGQILTVFLAHFFLSIEFNTWGLAACLGFVMVSNAWMHWKLTFLGGFSRLVILSILIMDSLILTATLHWSGGAHNPFTSFYLLHVTLAAVLLPGRYALGISALSVAGFVWLYATAQSCCGSLNGLLSAGISQDMHFQGMVVSLALTAVFISVFVGKIQKELSRSHRLLREAQLDLEKQERFHSLATLAAGVAHELATPLGTIALVSKEIEREIKTGGEILSLTEDMSLIRTEVERCRSIIDRLNIENLTSDIVTEEVKMSDWLDGFGKSFPEDIRKRIHIECTPEASMVILEVSRTQLIASLHALLKNACEADLSGQEVTLLISIEETSSWIRFQVTDQGPGVADDDIGKLGEPFYTTKSPHEGMGLGLFLVRMFAERYGGHLTFYSNATGYSGLTVQLDLPVGKIAS